MSTTTVGPVRVCRTASSCLECTTPLCPNKSRPTPRGARRHAGRGLCTPCHRRAKRTDRLADFERSLRTRDELLDEWDRLRTDGVGRAQAAQRMGMTPAAFERHLYRARAVGDPRAVLGTA